MAFQVTARDDCAGDNCPAFQIDPATGDVYTQGYLLTSNQHAETDAAGGSLPAGEGRLRIPGAVFERLMEQHRAR